MRSYPDTDIDPDRQKNISLKNKFPLFILQKLKKSFLFDLLLKKSPFYRCNDDILPR